MALLNSGIKLSSSGSGNSIGSILINNASGDAAFPAAATAIVGGVRSNTGGAAIFTVNPLAPASGATYGTIVAGAGATLYVEYNTNGQYRFDVLTGATAKTSPVLVSQWYNIGTEHTVGVNYNAIPTTDGSEPMSAIITLAVDGKVASSQIVDFTKLSAGTGTGLTIGSALGTANSAGNFNGYVDQYVVFKSSANLSPGEFANYTSDAAALANALTGHLEKLSVDPVAFTGTTVNNPNVFVEPHPGMKGTGLAGSNSLSVNNIASKESAIVTIPANGLKSTLTMIVAGATVTATNGNATAADVAAAFATSATVGNAVFTPGYQNTTTAAVNPANNNSFIITDSTNANITDYVVNGGTGPVPTISITQGSLVTTMAWTADATNGVNTIVVGDLITGAGIPNGDFVTSVTKSATPTDPLIVTLREGLAADITAGDVKVYHPQAISHVQIAASTTPTVGTSTGVANTDDIAAGETTLKLESVAGVRVGDLVSGIGIPIGYVVHAHDVTKTANLQVVPSTDSVTIAPLGAGTLITTALPTGTAVKFINKTGIDTQKISLASTATTGSGFMPGDAIQLVVPSGVGTSVTTTYYIVQSSDVKSTIPDTIKAIASSIVTAYPKIGLYDLAADKDGLIYMAPELTPDTASLSGNLPAIIVKSLNAVQVNENTVLDAYNFSSIAKDASTVARANGTANLATFNKVDGSIGAAILPGSINYNGGTTVTTGVQAVSQLKGPIFAELVSSPTAGTATYNLFVNSGSVPTSGLSSLGFTINQPAGSAAGGTITDFTPLQLGTLNQKNISTDNTSVNYQWVSANPVTDFSKPFATITVKNTDATQPIFAAQATNLSVNGSFLTDPMTPSIPMVESLPLNHAVYSVSGTIYQQYNSGTSKTAYATGSADQIVMANTDMNYTVTSPTASLDLKLQVNNTPVTALSPNVTIKVDVVDNAVVSGANTFSYNLNVPSNATNVSFAPAAGVTGLSVVNKGGYLTVSGSYTAPAAGGTTTTTGTTGTAGTTGTTGTTASSTVATLGTLTATLNNEFNSGSNFSIDSAILGSSAASGQSLYFGTAETNSSGAYTLSNLPSGQLALNVLNNATLATQKSIQIGLNDAISALNIAAGKGLYVTSAGASTTGVATALQVSDFVAADWNHDGKVTASDALNILQYYVNYSNLASAPLTYTYFPASAENNVGDGKIGVANAGAPALPSFQTSTNVSSGAAMNMLGINALDIIGVLQGDVVIA